MISTSDKKCKVCQKQIIPAWKYCRDHTPNGKSILLEMDTTPRVSVPIQKETRIIHEYGEGKCKMCGMYLVSMRDSQHFCDKICYGYFQKILWANARGLEIHE